MCSVLGVSSSGFYDWLKHTPSKREAANNELDNNIKSIFAEHNMRYGAPRITRALNAIVSVRLG